MRKQSKALTAHKIIGTLEEHQQELRKHGVKRIGLFGSYLKGTPKRQSDVDLLVSFDKPTFDNYMDLKFFLEKVLKRKVDLVVEDSLKPSLRYVREETLYAKA